MRSSGSSSSRSLQQRATNAQKAKFLLCVNTGDNIDLQTRKVYQVKPDQQATSHGHVRVVDDSGEDYLYPVD